MLAYLVDEAVGLRVQAPGVEAEDLDVLVQFPGHVYQDDVFGAAEGDPQVVAKMAEGELENILGRLVGICRGQFCDIEGVAHQAASCWGAGAWRS
ncbi:hypothetical protein D9M71_585540 [compost metagenome]